MTTPSPPHDEEDRRERVLLELAALTRGAPAAGALRSNEGRDANTVQPVRERRARRTMWLAAGGAAAVAVLGIAAVQAEAPSRPVAPSRASSVLPPMGPPETSISSVALSPPPETTSALSPAPTIAPPARGAPVAARPVPVRPAQAPLVIRRASGASTSLPSPQPSAAPNDPTLEELDRVP